MAKWLIAILGVFAFQAFAITSDADEWVGVHVPAKLLNYFINDKTCYSTPEYLESCNLGLRKFAEMTGQTLPKVAHVNFKKTLATLQKNANAKINLNQVRLEAIKAQAQYFDPHADFEPIRENRAARADQRQSAGLGVFLEGYRNQVRVKTIMPGSPAEAFGLRPGDILLSADLPAGHLDLSHSPLSAAHLTAAPGTVVPLEIERDGKTLSLQARFDNYLVDNVQMHMEGSTGYIRIASFMPDSVCEDFEEAVKSVIQANAKNLIVDLRNNTGGQVSGAICATSRLLGQKVVVGEKRIKALSPTLGGLFYDENDDPIEENEAIHWMKGGVDRLTDMPVVVLVDSITASASEIFAGALQDHQRALLVGVRTFGKAIMQENQAIKNMGTSGVWGGRTTSILYQPSGRSIQRTGLMPDFVEPSQLGDDLNAYWEKREADYFPRTVKVESTPWAESRTELVLELQKCTEGSSGEALKMYRQLTSEQRPDYQLAYAMAVLNCEK